MTAKPFTSDIGEVARVLKHGGTAIVPTDTVYGLAAALDRPEAVDRLYDLKGRPADKPIPVLVSRQEVAIRLANELTEVARQLFESFWPGPLTIIVDAAPVVPESCLSGGTSVGLRMPDHPALLSLLDACGGALAVTSANKSGEPETTRAFEAYASLGETPDIVLDCGVTFGGRPSSVVDSRTKPPRVLRVGALEESTILAAAGRR